jgi:hypothetical protein
LDHLFAFPQAEELKRQRDQKMQELDVLKGTACEDMYERDLDEFIQKLDENEAMIAAELQKAHAKGGKKKATPAAKKRSAFKVEDSDSELDDDDEDEYGSGSKSKKKVVPKSAPKAASSVKKEVIPKAATVASKPTVAAKPKTEVKLAQDIDFDDLSDIEFPSKPTKSGESSHCNCTFVFLLFLSTADRPMLTARNDYIFINWHSIIYLLIIIQLCVVVLTVALKAKKSVDSDFEFEDVPKLTKTTSKPVAAAKPGLHKIQTFPIPPREQKANSSQSNLCCLFVKKNQSMLIIFAATKTKARAKSVDMVDDDDARLTSAVVLKATDAKPKRAAAQKKKVLVDCDSEEEENDDLDLSEGFSDDGEISDEYDDILQTVAETKPKSRVTTATAVASE